MLSFNFTCSWGKLQPQLILQKYELVVIILVFVKVYDNNPAADTELLYRFFSRDENYIKEQNVSDSATENFSLSVCVQQLLVSKAPIRSSSTKTAQHSSATQSLFYIWILHLHIAQKVSRYLV